MLKDNKKAIAIEYTSNDSNVPLVTAKGHGKLAEAIINRALENGIEIIENKEFFAFENDMIKGAQIPEEVYDIVIKILTVLLSTNKIKMD